MGLPLPALTRRCCLLGVQIMHRPYIETRTCSRKSLAEGHRKQSDIQVRLFINPVELQSMFALADDDGSGYVHIREILRWLGRELKLSDESGNTIEIMMRQVYKDKFDKGITVDKLHDVIKEVFCCLAIPSLENDEDHEITPEEFKAATGKDLPVDIDQASDEQEGGRCPTAL